MAIDCCIKRPRIDVNIHKIFLSKFCFIFLYESPAHEAVSIQNNFHFLTCLVFLFQLFYRSASYEECAYYARLSFFSYIWEIDHVIPPLIFYNPSNVLKWASSNFLTVAANSCLDILIRLQALEIVVHKLMNKHELDDGSCWSLSQCSLQCIKSREFWWSQEDTMLMLLIFSTYYVQF